MKTFEVGQTVSVYPGLLGTVTAAVTEGEVYTVTTDEGSDDYPVAFMRIYLFDDSNVKKFLTGFVKPVKATV